MLIKRNTKSTFLPRLGLVCPKVVSGHNLDHMAPFSNPRPGFCMVFRRAHFIFLVPGTRFWTQGPIYGPRISKFGSGWAQDSFGAKLGPGKTWFCLGNGLKNEDMGNPMTQMDCMVPWRPLGELVWPQSLPKNNFQGISRFFGGFGQGPWDALYIPYWPFVAC